MKPGRPVWRAVRGFIPQVGGRGRGKGTGRKRKSFVLKWHSWHCTKAGVGFGGPRMKWHCREPKWHYSRCCDSGTGLHASGKASRLRDWVLGGWIGLSWLVDGAGTWVLGWSVAWGDGGVSSGVGFWQAHNFRLSLPGLPTVFEVARLGFTTSTTPLDAGM